MLKAFQPSVSVFCSEECFDAMRRCDMTFGIRTYVSQCQGQVESWDDWIWNHYIGRDEHVNQSSISAWVVAQASRLFIFRGNGMNERDELKSRESPVAEVESPAWALALASSLRSRNINRKFFWSRMSQFLVTKFHNQGFFSPLFVVSFVFFSMFWLPKICCIL